MASRRHLGDTDGTAFLVRLEGGETDRDGLPAIQAGHGRGTIPAHHLDEVAALGVSLHEEVQGQIGADFGPSADHGLIRIAVLRGDAALAAQDLDALIVAVGRLTAVIDGADSTVTESCVRSEEIPV